MNLITNVAPVVGTGFADPVIDATNSFRRILDVMAEPGTIVRLPYELEVPTPMHTATAAVCLTLCGRDSPVWLAQRAAFPSVASYLRFQTGCPFADLPEAQFAVALEPGELPNIGALNPGSDERPELSATLIVQVPRLAAGNGIRLTGPGIEVEARLDIEGLPDDFWRQRKRHEALFPCGIDILFASGSQLAALPRSTRIEI